MSNSEVKFVYFDVGDVLIRGVSGTLSSDAWKDFKRSIGISSEQDEEMDLLMDDLNQRMEVSDINMREAGNIIFDTFDLHLPEDFSFDQELLARFTKNESIWPLVTDVQESYTSGLLTNMAPGFLDQIFAAGLTPPVEWGIIVDSSKVKARKPEPKIYEIAQKESGFQGENILFIDNMQVNTAAAQKLGWQTYTYDITKAEEEDNALRAILGL